MYSKSMGTAYFGERRSGIHAPAAGLREPAAGLREPAYRQTVRVPPNYSGHAFRDGEERSPEQIMRGDIRGESHRDRPPHREEPPTPRFDGLPQVSTLGHRGTSLDDSPSPASTVADEDRPCGQACLPALPACRTDGEGDGRDDEKEDRSGEGGALRGLMERFPFGHGFGFEELLLIGLMLLLLHEGDGEGDLGETLVLLGVLLLCG